MANPLQQTIEALSKEKGVDPEVIIAALQDAIETAARKRYKNENMRARFNTETGAMELVAVKRLVETVLAQLVGPPESAARIALDSAFTTMGNRVLPLPDQRSEIIVDEAYATWDGGPMGVDCAKSSATDDEVEDTLSFGRELSLPEKGGDRPHILRYGHPYRLAQLPVYSGGMSLPRTEMPDDTGGGNPDHITSLLYYPPSCDRGGTTAKVSPYFRMLRHARIGPPVVLLPSGHARRINGPVGTEVARDLVKIGRAHV